MPVGHQYLSPTLFDKVSLHIHGNVTHAVADTD
jgi:hypothetical protein